MCLCINVYVPVYMCVRACESPRLMSGVFLDHFQAYSLMQDFSVEPELVDKASQASKVPLRLSSLPSKHWDCRWAAVPTQNFAWSIRIRTPVLMLAACRVGTFDI